MSLTQDPLAPVRAALLADAERDAARTLAAADADVEALRRDARARGEADARVVVAAERARTRRQARAVVQRARGEAFDELRRQVRVAAAGLRGAADYPELRRHLEEQARALVGDDARLSEPADGGVLAEVGGRRAALSLTGLADRVLDRLGPDLEGVWTP